MMKKRNIIIILLIIVIILIPFGFSYFGKINNGLLPTGNIDVFNIEIYCECEKCKEESKEEGLHNSSTSHLNKQTYNNSNNITHVESEKKIWSKENRLNIFSNPVYEFKNIIAPGSSNVYYFAIYNSADMNFTYDIRFIENCKYKINMKYKLKTNNMYIAGNENSWVTAEELNQVNLPIKAHDTTTYILEWKWFDSENDTYIGKNMSEDLYKLNMQIGFNQKN